MRRMTAQQQQHQRRHHHQHHHRNNNAQWNPFFVVYRTTKNTNQFDPMALFFSSKDNNEEAPLNESSVRDTTTSTTIMATNDNEINSSQMSMDGSTTSSNNTNEEDSDNINDKDEDDDEYEYIEYDVITETELNGSEWLVGTNWDRSSNQIEETWCRLVLDEKGKQVCVWGDGSRGTWNIDMTTPQFLSFSKENIWFGKNIWACTVSDYYYLQGTVRGWKYWTAASVLGQWQAKRLGIDPEEAGTPPWMEKEIAELQD